MKRKLIGRRILQRDTKAGGGKKVTNRQNYDYLLIGGEGGGSKKSCSADSTDLTSQNSNAAMKGGESKVTRQVWAVLSTIHLR